MTSSGINITHIILKVPLSYVSNLAGGASVSPAVRMHAVTSELLKSQPPPDHDHSGASMLFIQSLRNLLLLHSAP